MGQQIKFRRLLVLINKLKTDTKDGVIAKQWVKYMYYNKNLQFESRVASRGSKCSVKRCIDFVGREK